MARHPKNSPFNEKNICILAGSACFADTAIAAGGIWKPTALEDEIYWDSDAKTGIFRKMLDGCIPSDKVCERIHSPLNESNINLYYWRDHQFWIVLSDYMIGTNEFNKLLEDAWDYEEEAKILITNHEFLSNHDLIFRECIWEPRQIPGLCLSNPYTLELLTYLTARLRKANIINNLQLICRYSFATLDILERLLCYSPQLFIRWPLLLDLYTKHIWPTKIHGIPINDALKTTRRIIENFSSSVIYPKTGPPKQLLRKLNNNNSNITNL